MEITAAFRGLEALREAYLSRLSKSPYSRVLSWPLLMPLLVNFIAFRPMQIDSESAFKGMVLDTVRRPARLRGTRRCSERPGQRTSSQVHVVAVLTLRSDVTNGTSLSSRLSVSLLAADE